MNNNHKHWDIFYKPILTEKSSNLELTKQSLSFFTSKNIRKDKIKKSFEQLFGVKVIRIGVINCPDKEKRMGRRKYTELGMKKVIVKVDSINKMGEAIK